MESWSDEDWQAKGFEAQMLAYLNLKPQMLYKNIWKYKPPPQKIEEKWRAPQIGFIKLNYDGASKGNPGQEGTRGIL